MRLGGTTRGIVTINCTQSMLGDYGLWGLVGMGSD